MRRAQSEALTNFRTSDLPVDTSHVNDPASVAVSVFSFDVLRGKKREDAATKSQGGNGIR